MTWHDHAACKGQDPDRFFGTHSGSIPQVVHDFCSHCPTRFECLVEGVELGDWETVRAGMSAKKRRELRRVLVRMSAVGDREGFERVAGMSRREVQLLRRREAA